MDSVIENNNVPDEKNALLTPYEEVDSLINVADNMLVDIRTDLPQNKKISMPIAQFAGFGSVISAMLPAFRTVTQKSTIDGTNLFRWVNEGGGNVLKFAKNGNAWGAFKTADGTSKMAQFQPAGPIDITGKTILPIDPVTILIAVSLFSIEQQLSSIEEMQKRILSFLETEKESEIEADVEMLSNIIAKFKYNWDNEQFIASNHKTVVDIQRTARKNMLSYQKRVKEKIDNKKFLTLQSKIKSACDNLVKDFKYYRLSLFAFSMASLIEIMLSGNFKEENILAIKEEIQNLSFVYRDLFSECSVYLENMEKSSVETTLLKGAEVTSKAVGKLIGSIPKVKDGQVDEFFYNSSEQIKEKAIAIETDSIAAFADMSNPGTNLFTEKMDELILIYNQVTDIYFDTENIYLVSD